jgi:peptidoglycan/xylan/chitin deacetylase (PgdA/CDA1 family)
MKQAAMESQRMKLTPAKMLSESAKPILGNIRLDFAIGQLRYNMLSTRSGTINSTMNQPPFAAVSLAAATVAAGTFAYAALSPQSQLFGKTVVASRSPNQIALTYDDGPNDIATERLLDVLARHDVRATFFLIGRFVRQRPQIARAIAAAGHLIGNHTMTHPWLAWQSDNRIREELTGCNAALEDALGQPVRYFRPPHGARRPYVLRTARELGLTPVQWNVMTGDWNPISAETIANRAIRGVTRNRKKQRASNILLHDGGDQSLGAPRLPTVEATDNLLRLYNKQTGIEFVTVDSWG